MTADAMSSTRHHDLIIVGSGSGNSLVTPHLGDLDIAIVERGTFGGTCLNVGCIPTKMFVYAADLVAGVKRAHRLGVQVAEVSADWAAVRSRVFGRIDPISEGGREYRREDDAVTLYQATARFTGPRRLTLDPTNATGLMPHDITADRIVLAAGSRPVMLTDVPGLDRVDPDRGVHTSDTVMRMATVPRRIAIIGGGTIACEMAHVLSSFGSHVTTLVRGQQVLRNTEPRVAAAATAGLAERVDLRLRTTVSAATRSGQTWELSLSGGGRLTVDAVLVAVGRQPNADLLGLHPGNAAGVEVTEDGRIVVDGYQRTTADGVFALGDVSNVFLQKHVANAEARTVAHNLAHPDDLRVTDHRFVPFAIFADPQIAWFGPTRAELDATGTPYAHATAEYADVAYGWAMEDCSGFLTVYADPSSGQIIAAHCLGYQASMVLQPVLTAATAGVPAQRAARMQYWPHPSLTEVAENALLGLSPCAE